MKILAHYILFEKKIYKNSIVEITDNRVNILEFEGEIANTEFHNGIIIVSKRDYSKSVDYFKSILKNCISISKAVEKIAEEMPLDDMTGEYHLNKISF